MAEKKCENCRYYAELKEIYVREHDKARYKGMCMEFVASAISEDYEGCDQWEEANGRPQNIERRVTLCKDCNRFRPHIEGNYGDCVRQSATLTVKETDFCSCAERKYGYDDYLDHKYSGLVDE